MIHDEGPFVTPSQAVLLLERERLLFNDIPLHSPLRRGLAETDVPLRLLWDTRELAPFLEAPGPTRRLAGCPPRFLFVAQRGRTFDSHSVVQSVLDAGGLFVGHDTLTGHALETSGLPSDWVDEVMEHPHLLLVNNPQAALRRLLMAANKVAPSDFTTLAITGTNGKTSTVQILGRALEGITAKPVLRLGTLGIQIGNETQEGKTPTMPDFPGFLAAAGRAKAAGAAHIVMEATSIGLDQERLGDWCAQVAAFTNLTQDHLDYHGSMSHYFEAKALLFERHLAHGGTAVFNVDDAAWEGFADAAENPQGHVIGYGSPWGAQAFFARASKKVLSARYLSIAQRITHAGGIRGAWTLLSERQVISEVPFSLPLLGDFQHENAACAAACLMALGYPLAQVAGALQGTRLIPGRLEPVCLSNADGQDAPAGKRAQPKLPTVVVDYAHSPDALEKTLLTCRALVPSGGKLICVFGCGGDRDAGKRPQMGEIAARLADVCYVTSDNPRTEDPVRIVSDITAGVPHDLAGKIKGEVARARAIAQAIAEAAPQDLVLIAGKGHEEYQIVGTEKLPFSDVEEARRALASRVTPSTV